jgi:hypothetical protein
MKGFMVVDTGFVDTGARFELWSLLALRMETADCRSRL